jgi:hypothetical protein
MKHISRVSPPVKMGHFEETREIRNFWFVDFNRHGLHPLYTLNGGDSLSFLSLALFIAPPPSLLSLSSCPRRGKMVQISRVETFKCTSAM